MYSVVKVCNKWEEWPKRPRTIDSSSNPTCLSTHSFCQRFYRGFSSCSTNECKPPGIQSYPEIERESRQRSLSFRVGGTGDRRNAVSRVDFAPNHLFVPLPESYLSLLTFLLEFPLLLLFLLDSRFDLRERLPRERAKCRTVLLGLEEKREQIDLVGEVL